LCLMSREQFLSIIPAPYHQGIGKIGLNGFKVLPLFCIISAFLLIDGSRLTLRMWSESGNEKIEQKVNAKVIKSKRNLNARRTVLLFVLVHVGLKNMLRNHKHKIKQFAM
jgi:hypothetical protein